MKKIIETIKKNWVVGLLGGAYLIIYLWQNQISSFLASNTTQKLIGKAIYQGWLGLVDYLSAHVLFCLVPAFFLSGAFSVLIPQKSIFKYMGSKSNKIIAYAFAAISGLILEVCSCTILPLFAGIWTKGAGFGPAITFLFSGPGVTLLATPLTASVIGPSFAVIKLILSIIIAILIGVIMEAMFGAGTDKNSFAKTFENNVKKKVRKKYQSVLFFIFLTSLVIIGTTNIQSDIKYTLLTISTIITIILALKYYSKEENMAWMKETFRFFKMIFPVLLVGVFLAGAITSLIPPEALQPHVGKNTLSANLFAVLFGLIAYFPTLVEVPVAKTFMDLGMHGGPLMAYLIADPVVSLQTFVVVNKIIKPKKTITYAFLIILFSTLSGLIYGLF